MVNATKNNCAQDEYLPLIKMMDALKISVDKPVVADTEKTVIANVVQNILKKAIEALGKRDHNVDAYSMYKLYQSLQKIIESPHSRGISESDN
ncbi:MAG: hypothetical protein JSR46_04260, partial [Verrucomicrobia bacterium]|nr:hypothetical protein [Verrucomicrobiota bacterium]